MAPSRWTRLLADVAVALGFLAIGWLSTGAATTSEPDFVYTPRDGLFALLLGLATLPYAARRR
ncbi:hypothetical protein BH20ACT6_BH20ACT6_23810 [soil metagenome]